MEAEGIETRRTIVYVDSGLSGGGSFESLRQHLEHLNTDAFRPVAVFLNRTEYVDILRDMGVKVHLIRDLVYDREVLKTRPRFGRLMQRLALAPHLVFPPLSKTWEVSIHAPAIRALQRILKQEDAAILHANNQVNRDFYALIAGWRSAVPCIAHLRSFFSFGFNRSKARFANRTVARFVAYSPGVGEHWISRGLDRAKMEIVYNGIGELEIERPNLHLELGIPRDHAIIGAVGKIIPERGYDWLIRAFARLAREKPAASLVIIGEGEASTIARLKALVRDLGVGGRVKFAGRREKAADYIAAMDVLVLPYAIEPFGRVLLEAWSLGVPPILSDAGAIRNIVEDGKTAIIVPPGDEEELASATAGLINDRSLADRIAAEGKEAVAERFHIKRYAAEMERIYNDVLAESTAAPDDSGGHQGLRGCGQESWG